MDRNIFRGCALVLFSILLCKETRGGQDVESMLLPSVAESRIIDSLGVLFERGELKSFDQFGPAERRIAAGMIDRVQSTGLERAELFIYGKLLSLAGRGERAVDIMEDLGEGADVSARDARTWLISKRISHEEYERAEEMLAEFRRDFEPTGDHRDNLYWQVMRLANRYNEMNKPDEAIRLYMDELGSLSFDAPYRSFNLAEDALSLFIEAGRLKECKAMLDRYETGLRDALARHEQDLTPPDSTARADDKTARAYRRLVELYEVLEKRLDLVGAEAPALEFDHVYNADSTLALDDLTGSIVVIDFWGTWCLPCIEGFEELRRIYDDFHDRGVEILGVTSFQGTYRDIDTGEKEGSDAAPMSREREIEVTGKFIEKQGVLWPCAFSKRSVFDPEYTVTGVPMVVILDREGRIQFIQHGPGCEPQKRRIIASLLSESPQSR